MHGTHRFHYRGVREWTSGAQSEQTIWTDIARTVRPARATRHILPTGMAGPGIVQGTGTPSLPFFIEVLR